ncbi:phage virion morphogenesis protein [Labrenzia sp. PHM005]|uniref:phage virion morphogenesis protein n=1 Tax=Labrenzia sp. PHM005 TaxID=2590016 RepID=UPI00113FD716|nr:phage virion morphogenesis protein [Labrenzia sp. PHM005]QDG74452.1 phage virion morphogenesis protein [Labrenzia sp. PHM005]
MTGVSSAITIEDAAVNAALARIEAAGGDTLALMQEISGAMLFSVQRRFETETDPAGRPWKAHAPKTARARINRKRRGNREVTPKLLRNSNRLYQSIVAEASETEAATGTNLIYAGIHLHGGTITQYPQSRKVRFQKVGTQLRFARKAHKRVIEKPVTFGQRTIVIPARPYLGFSEEDRAEILAITEAHFEAAAEGPELS